MLNERAPSKEILKAVDRDHWSYKAIVAWLNSKGFVLLGSGAYTSTYGKKSLPYVIKVNKREDAGALKYYQHLSIQRSSKYFPKVYKIKTYVSISGDILFIVAMEKLVPLQENPAMWKNILNGDAIGFLCWLACLSHNRELAEFMEIALCNDGDEKCNTVIRSKASSWERKNSTMATKIKTLIKNSKKFAFEDLHSGNVMIRPSTGDAVLTDPLASY